jgi:hypothetical protein
MVKKDVWCNNCGWAGRGDQICNVCDIECCPECESTDLEYETCD